MATIYEGIPTFEERVVGASIVIDGRVEKALEAKVDYLGDQPQVQTTFKVKIENVLKGKTTQTDIRVRVVGGKAEKAETSWTVQMTEGDRVLLMLAPDYGPDYVDDMFVPYFCSCYPVTAKGEVKLMENEAKELVAQKIQIEKATAKLADLRSLISTVIQRQEKQETALAEFEPAEFREMPYAEVAEMPRAESNGATSASPEGEMEEHKEAG